MLCYLGKRFEKTEQVFGGESEFTFKPRKKEKGPKKSFVLRHHATIILQKYLSNLINPNCSITPLSLLSSTSSMHFLNAC